MWSDIISLHVANCEAGKEVMQMGWKCAIQIKGLTIGEPSPTSKHRMNLRKAAMEAGYERASKSQTLDRRRSHFNRYEGFRKGSECADTMESEAEFVTVHMKDGTTRQRKSRSNAVPGFAELCTELMSEFSGDEFVKAPDLVEATPDTGAYVSYSAALKRLAIKLSKICNDLRLMASGPRCGLNEINLPPMAPGSSIMPGKVNPVIPEVTNQVCFKVIGNDTAVAFAAEAGQLQLNVMEAVIAESILESVTWLCNVIETLRTKCIEGITVNAGHCYEMVKNSIGIVTALNPYIGYKTSTKVAKEALETGRSVYDLVLEHGYMTKEKLDEALDPKAMTASHELLK